eukprot:14841403-Alexandrium_andersonii.AAC.1
MVVGLSCKGDLNAKLLAHGLACSLVAWDLHVLVQHRQSPAGVVGLGLSNGLLEAPPALQISKIATVRVWTLGPGGASWPGRPAP